MKFICKQCNKEFRKPKSSVAKFCSRACYGLSMVGRKYDDSRNLKIAKTMKGRRPQDYPNWRPGFGMKGKKASLETRLKMSAKHRMPDGFVNYSTRRKMEMARMEYRDWRQAVFTRDSFTCQSCFVKGGRLEADHIKSWSLYPELRYEINNGRTLCKSCHRKTDTWGRRSWKSQNLNYC